MYDFSEYSKNELLKIAYHLEELEGYIPSNDDLKEALDQELEKRDLDLSEDKFRQCGIISIRTYTGEDTRLDVHHFPREDKETTKPVLNDTMWAIVHLENGEVIDGLTDFGYRTPQEAMEAMKAMDETNSLRNEMLSYKPPSTMKEMID